MNYNFSTMAFVLFACFLLVWTDDLDIEEVDEEPSHSTQKPNQKGKQYSKDEIAMQKTKVEEMKMFACSILSQQHILAKHKAELDMMLENVDDNLKSHAVNKLMIVNMKRCINKLVGDDYITILQALQRQEEIDTEKYCKIDFKTIIKPGANYGLTHLEEKFAKKLQKLQEDLQKMQKKLADENPNDPRFQNQNPSGQDTSFITTLINLIFENSILQVLIFGFIITSIIYLGYKVCKVLSVSDEEKLRREINEEAEESDDDAKESKSKEDESDQIGKEKTQ